MNAHRTRTLLIFGRLASLPKGVLLAFIRIYQRTLSPALPVLTMGGCGCRFAPTCSHYAAEAIRVHGAVRGGWLALRRLVCCTPLHPGGIDPVPPASAFQWTRRTRPHCSQTTAFADAPRAAAGGPSISRAG